jgi:hypothetical protein
MKKNTVIGVFAQRDDAEKAINYVHNKLSVPNDEISYLYRNTKDEVMQVDAKEISSKTPNEGAHAGASAGAWIGAIAGVVIAAGVIPVVGAFVAAGPILTALGVAGAFGSAAAGAIGGAVVGGLLGALFSMGVGEEKAKRYEDQVMTGHILVATATPDNLVTDVKNALLQFNATDVEAYQMSI